MRNKCNKINKRSQVLGSLRHEDRRTGVQGYLSFSELASYRIEDLSAVLLWQAGYFGRRVCGKPITFKP